MMERFRISEDGEGKQDIRDHLLTLRECNELLEEIRLQLITPEDRKKILQEVNAEFFNSEVYRLHFSDGLSQQEIADKMGVSVHTIYRCFKRGGWTPHRSTKKIDIDPLEVKQLYDSGLTQKEVAERLEVSESTIYRHFKKHGIKPHRIGSREEVDTKKFHELHDQEELSRKEIAKKLRVSERTISRLYCDENLEAHGQRKYENEEERETARKEIRKFTQSKVVELRRDLFGTKCRICQEEKKLAIHRKDGAEHNPDELWRLGYLRTLDPDEYAAVCIPCHRRVHWTMNKFDLEWDQIELRAKQKLRSESECIEPLTLPDKAIPSSRAYLEKKVNFKGNEDDLRHALFGDTCYFCGPSHDEKSLFLHRKDGKSHHSDLTLKEKYFRTLDPKDWVFLCNYHHLDVHWAMNTLGLKWDDLK